MTTRNPQPDDSGLPLRWAFILAVSAGVGYLVGIAAGVEAGFTAAIALATFLCMAIGKR